MLTSPCGVVDLMEKPQTSDSKRHQIRALDGKMKKEAAMNKESI
jgi:hypothetical protein